MDAPRRPGPDGIIFRRWVAYVTVGEAAGFLVPATVMAVAQLADVAPWPHYAAAIVAGLAEGAILGLAQSRAVRGSGLALDTRSWVAATSLAAGLAWSIGMLPSTLPGLDWTSPATIAGAVVGGLVLLLSIPTAQWPLLRPHLPRAWRWIPLNAVAWAVGILWTIAPSPVIDEATPVGVLVLAYGVAGLLMATTVAVITGLGLRRMLREAPTRARATAG